MTKNCPECGCELDGNENICPECGRNLNIRIEESNKQVDSGNNGFNLSKIMLIAVFAVVILIGAGILFTGSFNDGENILITVSESGEWVSSYDNNTTVSYYYYVNGYISGIPSDANNYFIRTIYYDSNNTELGKTTENLQTIHYMLSETDVHSLSSFFPNNQLYVDHIKIQVIKNNEVLKEFNESFDVNNVEFFN